MHYARFAGKPFMHAVNSDRFDLFGYETTAEKTGHKSKNLKIVFVH